MILVRDSLPQQAGAVSTGNYPHVFDTAGDTAGAAPYDASGPLFAVEKRAAVC